ncbi:MAG TPA: adenylate/guanylate cyclase domain-containing protein [Candidatus Acidoferrales bacterium]|nr:adenylate/guanylate cyclase domain-containing protein [Candidatus Acidoferrales bacterium]
MTCPACGHDNREAARFCDSCGRPLEARCPACGQATRSGARFCDGCGTALASPLTQPGAAPPVPASYTPHHLAERILKEGRALRGERKEVTVLFVDVQGSTELAGALDPEEFHTVMDGAFQLMLDAVHRWEGTVNQFAGDGIMALFGAPIAHEDHARRALHAALEIQRALAEYAAALRRDKGLAFQVRLGLNSGPVVVGAIGDDLRMDYTAQGLTTNLAARMQQAADPGAILVAALTYRLGEGYFRFRPLGPMRVRGVSEPVEGYVLEGEGTVISRLEASLRRGVSPFRGREAELLALGECWDSALQRQGQAVCLVGEPGIGKSRLAYEFRRSLGIADRIEGAALSHTRTAAYSVFRQMLRQLAGIEPDADLSTARDGLHRRLWDLDPALAGLVPEILPVLGTSCEILAQKRGAPPSHDPKDRFREAVTTWVKAECRLGPRLFVVEDLHWLDASSEELLRHLALEARSLPLMVLMTSRFPVTGSNLELGRIREITLKALGPEDIYALVDAQVEPYPATPRLRRVAAERCEGNPFFVEELVRAFRERGDLVLEDGAYDLREETEQVVPATISALIASRVDRLPASARELLADAAALGKEFPFAHLRALVPPERVEDDLALVERRGFLDRTSDRPIATLAFRHVLTQEVVYGTLLQPDRQMRHRRAAEMLEQLYRGRTEEVCDQLAHHWSQSDRRPQALPYLMTAADGAVTVGANQEAIGHLQSALALIAEHPHAAPNAQLDIIRLKLAGLHFITGER